MSPARSLVTFLSGGVLLLGAPGLSALIFFDTGDPAHNREVAPGGPRAGSGWQYQGYYKSFVGTIISPRHFITARHLGVGETTFVHKSFFSGEPADRVYYINPNANDGFGYWDLAGTDLRVFEVYGDFPGFAPIYTGSAEVGNEVVMIGRGVPRGATVTMMGETRGWRWGPSDKLARWGTNTVDAITTLGSRGEMLVTDFDPLPGTDECHATIGDSGGALFLKEAGTWKLAGIMYSVDSNYDTNTSCGDSSDFAAALFDATGFFVGSDNESCTNWNPVSVIEDTVESRAFSSRISASASVIQAITQSAIEEGSQTASERFDGWLEAFGAMGDLLPDGDADHDQWPNAVEYLGALDPTRVDEPRRVFQVEESAGKIRFVLRVRLDAGARGLSWEIQQCDDLAEADFQPVQGLEQVGLTRSLSEGVETVVLEIDEPPGSRMFYRLAVTLGS